VVAQSAELLRNELARLYEKPDVAAELQDIDGLRYVVNCLLQLSIFSRGAFGEVCASSKDRITGRFDRRTYVGRLSLKCQSW